MRLVFPHNETPYYTEAEFIQLPQNGIILYISSFRRFSGNLSEAYFINSIPVTKKEFINIMFQNEFDKIIYE